MRKPSKTSIKKLMDSTWARIVKMQADYKCEWCEKESYLNSHHFFSRSDQSLRWELSNGWCLCSGCHTLKTLSAHKAPADFYEFAVSVRGEQWLADLRALREPRTYRLDDYELILADLIQTEERLK